jgi:hypothetical protein
MAISPAPDRNTIFNADYGILGEYVQDDQRVPYFNPAASDTLIEPGEPVVIQWDGNEEVMQAQGPIWPGEWGMLVRYFTADLPCDFSASVIFGDSVMWDIDNKVVSIAADVTNGFTVGNASYHLDANIQNTAPTVDGNGRVVAATTTDTYCRVVVKPGAVTTKGTVAPL